MREIKLDMSGPRQRCCLLIASTTESSNVWLSIEMPYLAPLLRYIVEKRMMVCFLFVDVVQLRPLALCRFN